MKFLTRSRYALRAMIELALRPREESVPLKLIAAHQHLSIKYLEQIFVPLSKAGLIRSERGSQGGYRLALDPGQCTIGMVLRAMEGNFFPVECLDKQNCAYTGNCMAVDFWRGLGRCMEKYADSVTLLDLAEGRLSSQPQPLTEKKLLHNPSSQL